MQTRRQFLRDCSLVAAAASLAPAALARNPATQAMVAAGPGFAQFVQQVNTPFVLRAGSKMVSLLLVEASAFSASASDAEAVNNEKFSLLFRGAVPLALEQDTYWFAHPRLGRLEIFIVPIGCLDTAHRYYEAIFDRPVDATELAAQRARAPRRLSKTEPQG